MKYTMKPWIFFKILYVITFTMIENTHQMNMKVTNTHTLHNHCNSFTTCHDCKKTTHDLQCDWCHNTGCTYYPIYDCPRKYLLNNLLQNNAKERHCTAIKTNDPIFVPAGVRRFIKLELSVDDYSIFKQDIVCEIHLDESVIKVKAAVVGKDELYCDAVNLRTSQSVVLSYLRLMWGGVEPYSNVLLMVVYQCSLMANNCLECQSLNEQFECGWCMETSTCNLIEECSRSSWPWVGKTGICPKYFDGVSYFRDNSTI